MFDRPTFCSSFQKMRSRFWIGTSRCSTAISSETNMFPVHRQIRSKRRRWQSGLQARYAVGCSCFPYTARTQPCSNESFGSVLPISFSDALRVCRVFEENSITFFFWPYCIFMQHHFIDAAISRVVSLRFRQKSLPQVRMLRRGNFLMDPHQSGNKWHRSPTWSFWKISLSSHFFCGRGSWRIRYLFQFMWHFSILLLESTYVVIK